jgi:hypothetical protein
MIGEKELGSALVEANRNNNDLNPHAPLSQREGEQTELGAPKFSGDAV